MTINGNWGFSANDHGFKSTSQLLHNLIDIASKGGNYLLNVGPTDEGVIPEPEVERLKEMGDWLKTNGEALYGTTAGPFKKQLAWGRATQEAGQTLPHRIRLAERRLAPGAGQRSGCEGLLAVAARRGAQGRKRSARDSRDACRRKNPIRSPASWCSKSKGRRLFRSSLRPPDGSIHLAATDAEIKGSHLAVEGGGLGNPRFFGRGE